MGGELQSTLLDTAWDCGREIYQGLLNIQQSALAEEVPKLQILRGHENICGKYQQMLVLKAFVTLP